MKPLITLQKGREPYRYDCLNDRLLKDGDDFIVYTTKNGGIPLVGIKKDGSCITDLDEFPHYLDNNQGDNIMAENFIKEPVGWYRVFHSDGCGKVAFYYKVKPVVGEIIFASKAMLLDGSIPKHGIDYCHHCKKQLYFTECYVTDATLTLIEEM